MCTDIDGLNVLFPSVHMTLFMTKHLHRAGKFVLPVLQGTIKGTTNMISFKYSFLSALFGGVIGGVLGAMLTLKIFGKQGQEQADDDEEEAARHPAEMRVQPEAILRLPRREPVEHDYLHEI